MSKRKSEEDQLEESKEEENVLMEEGGHGRRRREGDSDVGAAAAPSASAAVQLEAAADAPPPDPFTQEVCRLRVQHQRRIATAALMARMSHGGHAQLRDRVQHYQKEMKADMKRHQSQFDINMQDAAGKNLLMHVRQQLSKHGTAFKTAAEPTSETATLQLQFLACVLRLLISPYVVFAPSSR
jgi:hypothetical protein